MHTWTVCLLGGGGGGGGGRWGQQERGQPVVGNLSTSLSFEGKVRDCLCSAAVKDSERLNGSKVNICCLLM